jgi:two-component system, OmpR family, KDP operon response regulator KdpE
VVSVLIVEDEAQIRELLVAALAGAGHAVRAEAAGMPALQVIVDDSPDVVVLDLGLPDVDGGDLLRMIRAVSQVPVIVATARDDDTEIVRLLDAGADEYIVKPFSSAELEARVRAVTRRLRADGNAEPIVVGGLRVDTRARVAELDGVALVLNRKEFDLLSMLASRAGEVVTREDLYAEVWRQPYGGADKTIDVHLSWLRRKLGESAAEPRYLHTVRGVGFRLDAPG